LNSFISGAVIEQFAYNVIAFYTTVAFAIIS